LRKLVEEGKILSDGEVQGGIDLPQSTNKLKVGGMGRVIVTYTGRALGKKDWEEVFLGRRTRGVKGCKKISPTEFQKGGVAHSIKRRLKKRTRKDMHSRLTEGKANRGIKEDGAMTEQ